MRDLLESQLFTVGVTGRDGRFVLPVPIPRGESFSVIIAAEGYMLQYEDDWLEFDAAAPAQVDLGTFALASQQ